MVWEGPAPNFIWNGKAIVGALALTLAVSTALRNIRRTEDRQRRHGKAASQAHV
jgi:hypothetical protein